MSGSLLEVERKKNKPSIKTKTSFNKSLGQLVSEDLLEVNLLRARGSGLFSYIEVLFLPPSNERPFPAYSPEVRSTTSSNLVSPLPRSPTLA
jgi:hypothetical protein